MNIFESFRLAFNGLNANKMRSFLTMLGVIIGVGSVILLVSIGQGAKSYITGEIQSLGSNLIFVMPGKIEFGGGQHPSGENKLSLDDVRLVGKKSKYMEYVGADIESSDRVKYGNKIRNVMVYGVTSNINKILNVPIVKGRDITESQVGGARKVVVIGKTVAEKFFGSGEPLGKRITIASQKFTVIGVLKERGQSMGVDRDDVVDIPITTAQSLYGLDRVSFIMGKARDSESVDPAIKEIKQIMGKRLKPNEFTVSSQGEMLGAFKNILSILTLMLAGIGGISLMVGGIGIMNIMLVSVTERTREIGVRKAVGAKTYDILIQFIIEAMTLSVLGGIIGISLGTGVSYTIKSLSSLPSEVTVWSVSIAFFFSAFVGVFFGVYPAWKASRLNPIDALRYE
ncbi:MAG: ABC transporter permease [Actinobacteria bacterium]|nr:ABC transporter permease [Actinomycetota bacterium]